LLADSLEKFPSSGVRSHLRAWLLGPNYSIVNLSSARAVTRRSNQLYILERIGLATRYVLTMLRNVLHSHENGTEKSGLLWVYGGGMEALTNHSFGENNGPEV